MKTGRRRMAGEAPMLVQQVQLPQMRLLVLLVPQVRPLVLGRRSYYYVTYFAFLRHQTGFRTIFWPASAIPSAERRFRPQYNSSFYVFLSCLPLSQRDCALRIRSIYMLIRLSRGVFRAEIQLRTIPR